MLKALFKTVFVCHLPAEHGRGLGSCLASGNFSDRIVWWRIWVT